MVLVPGTLVVITLSLPNISTSPPIPSSSRRPAWHSRAGSGSGTATTMAAQGVRRTKMPRMGMIFCLWLWPETEGCSRVQKYLFAQASARACAMTEMACSGKPQEVAAPNSWRVCQIQPGIRLSRSSGAACDSVQECGEHGIGNLCTFLRVGGHLRGLRGGAGAHGSGEHEGAWGIGEGSEGLNARFEFVQVSARDDFIFAAVAPGAAMATRMRDDDSVLDEAVLEWTKYLKRQVCTNHGFLLRPNTYNSV